MSRVPLARGTRLAKTLLASFFLATLAHGALADDNGHFHGATNAEWGQRFWKWYMPIPAGVGPANDVTGANCGINQDGDVWFIGGPLGGPWERTCDVPTGTALVVPVVNWIDDYPCPPVFGFEPAAGQKLEDFLLADVANYVGLITTRDIDLDGHPLQVQRVTSGLFSFIGAADLVTFDPCITGAPQLAVNDGYYTFVNPLSPGEHVFHVHSVITWPVGPPTTTDGTLHVVVAK